MRWMVRDVAHKAIGDILDQLGVTADLDDGDLVSSAVVVLAILIEGDQAPRLTIATSEGIGWIQQAGLLRLAERITSEPPDLSGDDD